MLVVVLKAASGLAYPLISAAALAASCFVWGYWRQAMRRKLFPPLSHLQRRQYAAAWDQLAYSREEACAAAGVRTRTEEEFRNSAVPAIENLLQFAAITKNDQVLEVGCGVGRIGEGLAPHCSSWTGADISANMLSHASERLQGFRNVSLVRLKRGGLSEFAPGSFDVVYFTSMLMHLDELDRWLYVSEASRVLRPGGRIFTDIMDIESDAGWAKFIHDVQRYKHLERPPYLPRYSSATELTVYLERAGFGQILSHRCAPVVVVTGIK